jgi:hypothetical protein
VARTTFIYLAYTAITNAELDSHNPLQSVLVGPHLVDEEAELLVPGRAAGGGRGHVGGGHEVALLERSLDRLGRGSAQAGRKHGRRLGRHLDPPRVRGRVLPGEAAKDGGLHGRGGAQHANRVLLGGRGFLRGGRGDDFFTVLPKP